MNDDIIIKGARENNLKNIDVTIPKNKLVVFTGVSGSGKSTLAFDTIFAEGQRRYIESLSSYARQFLGSFEKPDVDSIEGLSPAISIDQKTTSHNPRSTVGTVTEIYDYLRLLFARVGVCYCPNDGCKIEKTTIQQIVNNVKKLGEGTRVTILSPVVHKEKGTHAEILKKYFDLSFRRMRIDSTEIQRLEAIPTLDKNKKHSIDIVIDRMVLKEENYNRLFDSLRLAIDYSKGYVIVLTDEGETFYSEHLSCPECGFSVPPLEPRLFSFNNPLGSCKQCNGLGLNIEADPAKIVPDDSLSINKGAIKLLDATSDTVWAIELDKICELYNIDKNIPFNQLTDYQKDRIFYGPEEPTNFTYTAKNGSKYVKTLSEGFKTKIDRLYYNTESEGMKKWYQTFMSESICTACHGARLSPEVLSVKVGGLNIYEVCCLSLDKLYEFVSKLPETFTQEQKTITALVITEIKNRVKFLIDVGLEYLTLARMSMTLSGGESQRIRLATQIGSKLSGVLYVLDEPSIGLHQRDNDRLIATLKEMRDLGNSLIVVEHDEDTMRAADFIVDVGPLAGEHGGEIVVAGTPEEVAACDKSITGRYLSGKEKIEVPKFRREAYDTVTFKKCHCHNLKDIDVKIPLGTFVCVTGVSGSGKSSLVTEVIYKNLYNFLNKNKLQTEGTCQIVGANKIKKLINISQEPIGKTPRSNPATYIGVFDDIRTLFASTQDAQINGITKSMFSFNLPGGRCEACWGDGVKRIQMNFLPDVYVTCDVCEGKRYNQDVLAVKYKDKNIYDVLEMRIDEAYEFFKNIPSIERKLRTLVDVGLGYMKLGQSSVTLSGGEAQRVKLASELQKRAEIGTLYILDEPTTGLHSADVKRLISILDRIVANGNTVLVIEHNLDLIKCADYIIDLGPEGGDKGGNVIATGTPEQVAEISESYTGQYIKKILNK